MGVEKESGQSVLEFILMLPLMVALTMMMVRVNTAIQVSIVNQQYARAHALWLTFNSPEFPRFGLRIPDLTAKTYNQMVLGVSDNSPNGDKNYIPSATVENIARKAGAGSDENHAEPAQRSKVRIRDTVSLCTQANVITTQGGLSPIVSLALVSDTGDAVVANGPSLLNENAVFDFCRSPLK